jgi:hypothetical protein
MTDIDFDELDRAVSGVLGGSKSSTEPTNEPTSQPQTIQRTERTVLSPAFSSPYSAGPSPLVGSTPTVSPAPTVDAPVIEPIVASTPVAPSTPAPSPTVSTAPAARRSSGRFMDMVHPSSDMRSKTAVLTSPVATRPEPSRPQSVRPEATHLQTAPVAQPIVSEPVLPKVPAWNEPLESPFLPDAKVEKRPLGGGDASKTEDTSDDIFDFQGLLDDEPEELLLEAPEVQERLEATTMPDPIDFAAASSESDSADSTSFDVEPTTNDTPFTPPVAPVVTEPQNEPVYEAPTTRVVPEEPIGPTSITPQYKEQPSSNQETGAMYDTESYHQPVSQPVKKKSGWLTVLWILLLIIIGAGAGFAVFTYVLPML